MNESLLSLLSVCFGIFGAMMLPILTKRNFFGLIGNIIIGVFGSVFFTKLIGRFGVNPMTIIENNQINYLFLILYFLIAIIGGAISLWLFKKIISKR